MLDAKTDIPFWPKIVAEVNRDGTAEVMIDETTFPVDAPTVPAARAAVLALVSERTATDLRRPVRVDTKDPSGQWQLIVHPDGRVEAASTDDPEQRARPTERRPSVDEEAPVVRGVPSSPSPTAVNSAQAPRWSDAAQATTARPTWLGLETPPPTLQDLLAAEPTTRKPTAKSGWQATVGRLTNGVIAPPPGPAEVERHSDITEIQRSFHGTKTIVVVNPKGGANKTTAAMLLAATLGLHRGGYTLAWDNNETRGTLGWRAEGGGHTRTAVDLLRDLEARFSPTMATSVADLDDYVRRQASSHFDVLASDEDAASAASIDAAAFHQLHRVLARFYRLMVIDTGNNMRAENWRAAIEAADQLVIVSTVRKDTASSAAWLIDALRKSGKGDLIRRAVTLLNSGERTQDARLRRQHRELQANLHDHFGRLTRIVVDVPHDPSLVNGGAIHYGSLSQASRSAWLKATAAVASGL